MLKKYRKDLIGWSFLYIPFMYLLLAVPLHTGYKEEYGGYFANAALISILLSIFTTKRLWQYVIKSFIGLFLVMFATDLFWSYMDHPWFAGPETHTCDGPCFGWFSFENDSPSIFFAFFAIPFILVTGILKSFLFFIIKLIKKSK